jgi:NADPH-dependent glutamate synthase beta subunit-like oxidoreductase
MESPERAREMTDGQAKAEALKCLFCFDAPCQTDCPVGIDAPGFIRRISQQNVQGAYHLIHRENPLPWICGILCPTERLCASRCPRKLVDHAIDIGRLQAYASIDKAQTKVPRPSRTSLRNRVAVVGTGPAGLTAISCLARDGFQVVVYEAADCAGGLITYGIPPYKIDKRRAFQEIGNILDQPGISVHLRTRVPDPNELLKEHGAAFVATGIGGEKLGQSMSKFKNLYRATEFLKTFNRTHLQGRPFKMDLGPEVLVIGGGNTALNAAVSIRFLGFPNVTVIYRRTETEMPAWSHEMATARKCGVNFRFLLEPSSFIGDEGKVSHVVFRQTELGDPGADGRRKVLARRGKKVEVAASSVILSTGREKKNGLKWLKKERVDQSTGRLEGSNIFLGGELLRGAGLIVQAVADGKKAAHEIERLLRGRT